MGIGEYLYYHYAYNDIVAKEQQEVQKSAQELLMQLKRIHQSFQPSINLPKLKNANYAIYDIDKNYLFGTFQPHIALKVGFLSQNNRLYLIQKVQPHYAGAAYMVIERPFASEALDNLRKWLFLFSLFALFVIVATAYFLGKLFLAPMKEAMVLLDSFIKDATHELNTPISVILTNLELFEELYPECKAQELKRAELAALKLSKIFKNLSIVQLRHQVHKKVISFDLATILKERISYFEALAKAKEISFKLDITHCTIEADKEDVETIIDNLLSNAIKYSPSKKEISVSLSCKQLCIEDQGIGIEQDKLDKITKRFFRAESQEGGFGLGLYIVDRLCQEYGWRLSIISQKEKGTKVCVLW